MTKVFIAIMFSMLSVDMWLRCWEKSIDNNKLLAIVINGMLIVLSVLAFFSECK